MKTKKIAAAILVLIVSGMIISACGSEPQEDAWPTVEPTDPGTGAEESVSQQETQVEPLILDELPDFDTWEIGEKVTDEQKIYINRLVEFAWYRYFSPHLRPDCQAIKNVFTTNNPWNDGVEQNCQKLAERNYYVMHKPLPDSSVEYYAYPDHPHNVSFVVRVSTDRPWEARVRYFNDGKQMGFLDFIETVVDFHIAIEDGKLLIALIDQFQRDQDGNIFVYNNAGELVSVDD